MIFVYYFLNKAHNFFKQMDTLVTIKAWLNYP